MQKCTKIIISENEYPIRFDYTVFRELYKKYKDIKNFQLDLLGLEVIGKDENGKDILAQKRDPSLRLFMFLLPLMINSALDYKGLNMIDSEEIIKQIDVSYINIAPVLNLELNRCFDTYIESDSDSDNEQIEMKDCQFAEILFLAKNKLGYTDHEARHIYIGEYLEQMEQYKKYYNFETQKYLYPEKEEKEKN